MKKKEKDYLVKFSMFLRVGVVDFGFFLSIILGNFGVNIIGFCREFNEFSK